MESRLPEELLSVLSLSERQTFNMDNTLQRINNEMEKMINVSRAK
jgi:hypothetical protein